MKKKIIFCCTLLIIFTVGCGKKETIKSPKTKIKSFEVIDKVTEDVNGNASIKITLKNTSKKTKEVPEFYIRLLDKNDLVITDIENNEKKEVLAGDSISFELMTQTPYKNVSNIEYHEKKQEN